MARILAVLIFSISYLFGQAGSSTREQKLAAIQIYVRVATAQAVRAIYDERQPQNAPSHQRAYQAWIARQGLDNIEQIARTQLSSDQIAGIHARIAAQRKGLESNLRPNQTFEQLLAGPGFQIRTELAEHHQLLFPSAAGSAAINNAPAATGTIYSVADLNSLLGAAYDRATGRHSDKLDAAVAELKRLGRINVSGKTSAKTGRMLEFENADFRARWNIYLTRFENDDVDDAADVRKNQTVTVSCLVDKVKVFIELNQCRLIRNPAGLTAANIPLHKSGLRRQKLAPDLFQAANGNGLKPAEVDGIYMTQQLRAGVGGYLYYELEPVLVLKNGLLYNDPKYAPAFFNAELSQQREPHKWGRVTPTGDKKARVVWLERDAGDGDTDYSMYMKATPGPPGLKLNGSYSYITGAGNLSVGGQTNVVATNSYTFTPDGRFSRNAAAGASTPGVATSSHGPLGSGTYKIDGWTIFLNYDDGRQDALLFGAIDNTFSHVFLGTTMYLKKKP